MTIAKLTTTTFVLTTCLFSTFTCAPIPTGKENISSPRIISHSPIQEPNEPIIYKDGLKLELHCFAKSGDAVIWKWLRNGVEFKGEDGYHTSSEYVNTNRANQSAVIELAPMTEPEANYTCVALNQFGKSSHTFTLHKEKARNWLMEMIGLSTILGSLLLGMGLLLIYFVIKRGPSHKPLDPEQANLFFNGPEAPSENADGIELVNGNFPQLPYDRSKEIKMKSLVFGRYIGGGISGRVEAALLLNYPEKDVHKQVAVKSIRKDRCMTHEERQQQEWAFLDFIHKEIKISQLVCSFGSHENVVGYIGSVVEDLAKHKAYLIVEYCSGGDLASLLRKHKARRTFHNDVRKPRQGGQGLKTSHLIKWAGQIAAGLEHLASLNIPHMDLAARNILLAHEEPELNSERYLNPSPANLIAKISDLGMARELNRDVSTYYRWIDKNNPERNRRDRCLPIRWMAVEALETLTCTLESDIWSLGVVFWEMFTLGEFPYGKLKFDPKIRADDELVKLIKYLRNGRTLKKPPRVPPKIWEIMRDCWSLRPGRRPSPKWIKEQLQQLNEEITEQIENMPMDVPHPPQGVIYVQIENMAQWEEEEQPRYMNMEGVPV